MAHQYGLHVDHACHLDDAPEPDCYCPATPGGECPLHGTCACSQLDFIIGRPPFLYSCPVHGQAGPGDGTVEPPY